MREMTVTVACDRCGDTVRGADGTHEGVLIMFQSSGQLRVDLCEECEEELREELRPILERGLRYPHPPGSGNGNGRRPMPPRAKVDCPRCGQQVSMGSGLTIHARKRHPEEAFAIIEEVTA